MLPGIRQTKPCSATCYHCPKIKTCRPDAIGLETSGYPGRQLKLEDISQHQLTYLQKYDRGYDPLPDPHRVGDPVKIQGCLQTDGQQRRYRRFLPKWLRPYSIRELHFERVYMVDRYGTPVRVPAYDAEPAYPPEEPVPADVNIESPGYESKEY